MSAIDKLHNEWRLGSERRTLSESVMTWVAYNFQVDCMTGIRLHSVPNPNVCSQFVGFCLPSCLGFRMR